MIGQVVRTKTTNSRWSWLYKVGGVAALITGVLLLTGMISLIGSVLQPGTNSWYLPLRDSWLVKIFVLHAELGDIHADLQGLNLLDVGILVLVSVMCLSLSAVFRNARRTWSLAAFALSLIAILLFLVTQIAGRSTVMLAVLINSIVMFGEKSFDRISIYVGIVASVLLFAGDLTVGVRSDVITILFGIGYVLLTLWFFLVAQSLFSARRGVEQEQRQ